MLRSGSTWQYNAVRVLLQHAGATDIAGGYMYLAGELLTHRTVIIKSHEFYLDLAVKADVILTAHRDLRDVAASMQRKFQTKLSSGLVKDWVKRHVKWSQLAAYDLHYENLLVDKLTELKKIASVLKLPQPILNELPYESILEEIEGLKFNRRFSKTEAADVTNLLHAGHVTDGRHGSWKGVISDELVVAIEKECRGWMVSKGYLPAPAAVASPEKDAGGNGLKVEAGPYDTGLKPAGYSVGNKRALRLTDLPPPPAGKTGWPWTKESPFLPARMPGGSVWPRISIVTPSLNQAKYIEETIRSVLLQNYPNLEFIVIDGGSDDITLQVLRKYEGFIDYFVSEPDKGQADALNKGMRRATGEILAFINSDDFYLPGAFATVAQQFNDATGVDLIYGGCRLVDQNSLEFIEHFGDISRLDEVLDFWNVWCANREIVQPEAFWRRSVFEKTGAFNARFQTLFAYDYWCRMLIAGATFRRFDEALACFRFHPAQKSRRRESNAGGEWLDMVAPWLWDRSVPLPSSRRRTLQGEWLYYKRFIPTIGDSTRRHEPKWRRWARLAGVCASHPQIFASSVFKQRMREVLRGPR
jgi:glycosyltransferase involved in cell wall biosynthesis